MERFFLRLVVDYSAYTVLFGVCNAEYYNRKDFMDYCNFSTASTRFDSEGDRLFCKKELRIN